MPNTTDSSSLNLDIGSLLQNALGVDPLVDAVISSLNPDLGYGKREDGTNKGRGFFGEVPHPGGGISTELSVGMEIDGKETLMPLLTPNLSRKEIDTVLNSKNVRDLPESLLDKVADHARSRIKSGKSTFAGIGEQYSLPKE